MRDQLRNTFSDGVERKIRNTTKTWMKKKSLLYVCKLSYNVQRVVWKKDPIAFQLENV